MSANDRDPQRTSPRDLPRTRLAQAFHVGRLDQPRHPVRHGRRPSAEGSGLSISLVPESWAGWARCEGPTWLLERQDGEPMDLVAMTSLTPADRKWLDHEAVTRGWMRRGTVYEYTYYDDDMGMEMVRRYRSGEEFLEDGYEEEDLEYLKKVRGFHPARIGELYREEFGEEMDVVGVRSQSHIATLEEITGADGLWWNAPFDRLTWTASRGVIFQRSLPYMKWRHATQDEVRRLSRRD